MKSRKTGSLVTIQIDLIHLIFCAGRVCLLFLRTSPYLVTGDVIFLMMTLENELRYRGLKHLRALTKNSDLNKIKAPSILISCLVQCESVISLGL